MNLAIASVDRSTPTGAGEERADQTPHNAGGMNEAVAMELCDGLIDIVAALFNVPGKELRRPGRTSLAVARVRQIAMYVAHVALRMPMADIGRGFGRDRTTVTYACHTVENLRDEVEFDRMVIITEKIAVAAFRNRLGL